MCQLASWDNLLLAWKKASAGKRRNVRVAAFEWRLADELLELQRTLLSNTYTPGAYTHFYIHEPKRRLISAAPFRDRLVHHALCNTIEPRFEQVFIPDSYANRVGKGTHAAIDRLHDFAKSYRFALRMDIVQHFASIDHSLLVEGLMTRIPESDVLGLCCRILQTGERVFDKDYRMVWFPGDDLLAALRPRGLPIGNLTSQFWSNCYLHALDLFIKRELGCKAYVRYVDDFALFADSKQQLWSWKRAIVERLQRLRLVIHESKAQVVPVSQGIPWLGFLVFPTHRRVKNRKIHHARRRLDRRYRDYLNGSISFAEFDASVQGWINHVRYADTWRLRERMLDHYVLNRTEK